MVRYEYINGDHAMVLKHSVAAKEIQSEFLGTHLPASLEDGTAGKGNPPGGHGTARPDDAKHSVLPEECGWSGTMPRKPRSPQQGLAALETASISIKKYSDQENTSAKKAEKL
ncbi:hypothetical protein AK830_g4666 [Neonectria ditissima]|uniref:Uncharacterized protein n=1 Tax=Neonectria ditissima TaxID=78410 RepID=A0A0P7B7Q3_9HYPO|nr:hypothetical protein AK830_g4666 [Neonectria ditissima]